MKKILFFCLIALFASCSAEEELQGMSAESTAMLKELENVTNGYELMIKGYSLEEIKKEKDESPKKEKVETAAESWMIKAIQNSMSKTVLSYGNKTRADAQPYGGEENKVGVFKTTSCGNDREFEYFMDCEDTRGYTAILNGSAGATTTDNTANMVFRFCLVAPGNYGGGTLLLYNYVWNWREGDVDIVKRYHDNEDSKNMNRIHNNGGLSSTGLTVFSENTTFFWRFSERRERTPNGLVLRYKPFQTPEKRPVEIFIDDEDTRNGNDAYVWMHRNNPNAGSTYTLQRKLEKGETFRGITVGENTSYLF